MTRPNTLLKGLLAVGLLGLGAAQADGVRFRVEDVYDFCGLMAANSPEVIAGQIDRARNAATPPISKADWNDKYVYGHGAIYCGGGYKPIIYSMMFDYDNFKALVDYGLDLNRPFKDHNGDVTTIFDYAYYISRHPEAGPHGDPGDDPTRWREIFRLAKKAKRCKDLPPGTCTGPYAPKPR